MHTYSALARGGYSEQGIADIFKVVDDLVQEYVHDPRMGDVNGLIGWLRNEIERFGSLALVNINLLYQNKDLTSKILQSKERLQYEQQYFGQNKSSY